MMSGSDLFLAVAFGVCATAIVYAYAIYPCLIWAMASFKKPSTPPPARSEGAVDLPTVTLLIAAYNEEAVIAERIENALAMDYPRELLEIVVGLDGCSDRTAAILRSFEDRRVRVFDFSQRRGKATVLNEVIAKITNEIVMMSDANTESDPQVRAPARPLVPESRGWCGRWSPCPDRSGHRQKCRRCLLEIRDLPETVRGATGCLAGRKWGNLRHPARALRADPARDDRGRLCYPLARQATLGLLDHLRPRGRRARGDRARRWFRVPSKGSHRRGRLSKHRASLETALSAPGLYRVYVLFTQSLALDLPVLHDRRLRSERPLVATFVLPLDPRGTDSLLQRISCGDAHTRNDIRAQACAGDDNVHEHERRPFCGILSVGDQAAERRMETHQSGRRAGRSFEVSGYVLLLFGGAVLCGAAIAALAVPAARRRGLDRWLLTYVRERHKRRAPEAGKPVHLLLCIADHFEPGNGGVTHATAHERMKRWVEDYPGLCEEFLDSDGRPPRHTFFYPIEMYEESEVDSLANICRLGLGGRWRIPCTTNQTRRRTCGAHCSSSRISWRGGTAFSVDVIERQANAFTGSSTETGHSIIRIRTDEVAGLTMRSKSCVKPDATRISHCPLRPARPKRARSTASTIRSTIRTRQNRTTRESMLVKIHHRTTH